MAKYYEAKAFVSYRNFSKIRQLTVKDGALSGFETEIDVLKCMADLQKNQKMDADFMEKIILKSPDLSYKIASLKKLKATVLKKYIKSFAKSLKTAYKKRIINHRKT